MNTNKEDKQLNDAAEKFYEEMLQTKAFPDKDVCLMIFETVFNSKAGREYAAQFQLEQKQVASVWVKEINRGKCELVLENKAGDTYTFKPKDEGFIDFLFDVDETPQPTLTEQDKQFSQFN